MALPSVTYDRVKQLLDQRELKYIVDENDGEIGIGFPELIAWINVKEPVIRAYALWSGKTFVNGDFDRAVHYVNHLNSRNSVPKTMLVQRGEEAEGRTLVMEYSMPMATGMTDEQLGGFIDVALQSFFAVVTETAKEFPELAPETAEED